MKKIEGLIAASFAAYKDNGEINLDIIPEIVENLIADGLAGVFICGTNGEGPNLTIEERMAIAEAYVKAVNKRIIVMVHVGHSSIYEAKKLAAHAQGLGVDAISSVSAFYFKPSSVKALVISMAEIASAAPETPFYYYNIPHLTGISMDMLEFLNLAEELIPSFRGVKYTASTLHEYEACLNHKDGKFDILFGFDEMLLPALAVGAKGAVGSTYTFAAPLYNRIIECFQNNQLKEARDLQMMSIKMVQSLVKFAPIPAQRAIVGFKGINLGPCRLPLLELKASDKELLIEELEKKEFFSTVKDCIKNHSF
ncbi:dihydrodipicolinate synthase family protein [Albibacterium bauzanense]|uniref:N-acetylneuraminate lyase n=1 Tax=Albibacterium bauzanense TaxID=653929 RepID=A0A4R1LPS4_9SPHI|nr:dihydrodipicolinate synthase family protein [Albibacterium bauzanense]TCK80845.1 N-acetylneuraminate lyase [Albibacterium bauzanense]